MALFILALFLHSMQENWDQGTLETLGTERTTLIGSKTHLGPSMDPAMALFILAIFLHSMQEKWDQGTLGTERTTLIGSRTHLRPSMDPAMALQYTCPLYIGYIFAFYATIMGSNELWGHKGLPSYHVTKIHENASFIEHPAQKSSLLPSTCPDYLIK